MTNCENDNKYYM